MVYALAVLSTIAATLFRPAHSALLPSLCHTGHELASANVVRGMLDSAATLVGPLLAAVLLEVTDVGGGVRCGGRRVAVVCGAPAAPRYDAPPRPPAPARPGWSARRSRGRGGRRNRDLALILGLAAAQSFTRGALTVLSVVVVDRAARHAGSRAPAPS